MVAMVVGLGALATEKYFVGRIRVFGALLAEILEVKSSMILTLEINWPIRRTDVDNSMIGTLFRVGEAGSTRIVRIIFNKIIKLWLLGVNLGLFIQVFGCNVKIFILFCNADD